MFQQTQGRAERFFLRTLASLEFSANHLNCTPLNQRPKLGVASGESSDVLKKSEKIKEHFQGQSASGASGTTQRIAA